MDGIKGIIFDLDGTLIDSISVLVQAFNETIEPFGLEPVTTDRLWPLLDGSRRMHDFLLELSPTFFSHEDIRQKCQDGVREAYFRLAKDTVQLMPGAKDVLALCRHKGLKVGVVTARLSSGERKWLEIRRLGIADLIDAMVTGAEAPRKPAPDGIFKCLEELGLSPKESVYIGDTHVDIIAARRANMKVIAVRTEFYDKTLLAAENPTMIIDNLMQLSDVISELSDESGTTPTP